MKKVSSSIKFLAVVAVCSFLFLPAVSSADEVFGPVDFGVGTHTETFYLGARTMSFSASPSLKSLSIAVQNGTRKDKERVSSAVVTVNGEDIFIQKDFNQNVSSLIKTVDVDDPAMTEVVMTVKVRGKKTAMLSVSVTAIYEEALDFPWYLDTDGDLIGGFIMVMGTATTPPPQDLRGTWVPVGGDMDE